MLVDITYAEPYVIVWCPDWQMGAWALCSKRDTFQPDLGAAIAMLKVCLEHLDPSNPQNDVTDNELELPEWIDDTAELDMKQILRSARNMAEMIRNGQERALVLERTGRQIQNAFAFFDDE